jgi:nucleoid-associated protein YgaU
MTRETRIALLVGLAFIVLFGIVLGQRSINLSKASPIGVAAPTPAPAKPTTGRSGTELATGHLVDPGERPVLDLHARRAEERHETILPPVHPETETAHGQDPVPGPGTGVAVVDPPHVTTTRPADKPPLPVGFKPYTVQSGDTYTKIAAKLYGKGRELEWVKIADANKDKPATKLSTGVILAIPPADIAVVPAPGPGATLDPRDRIRGAEELTTDELRRRLLHDDRRTPADARTRTIVDDHRTPAEERTRTITEDTRTPVSPIDLPLVSGTKTYVIKTGDNPSSIARKEMKNESKATVDKLLEANRDVIKDPSKLKVGTTIRIPTS